MKQLVNSTMSKSRQPNHIISYGGTISTKLASATVQDASINSRLIHFNEFLEMDMNTIIKKLAVKGGPNKDPQANYQSNYVQMGPS